VFEEQTKKHQQSNLEGGVSEDIFMQAQVPDDENLEDENMGYSFQKAWYKTRVSVTSISAHIPS
jgi:hypothetical protein